MWMRSHVAWGAMRDAPACNVSAHWCASKIPFDRLRNRIGSPIGAWTATLWFRVHSYAAVQRERSRFGSVSLISDSRPLRRASTTSYRSEEHTSELQSRENLVCRLLLEKKKES